MVSCSRPLRLRLTLAGVHATLYITAMCLLWQRRQQQRRWMVYITAAFIVSSVLNGAASKFGQMVFIDNREYPGGPGAYLVEQGTAAPNVATQVAGIVTCWLQDGLLVRVLICAHGLC